MKKLGLAPALFAMLLGACGSDDAKSDGDGTIDGGEQPTIDAGDDPEIDGGGQPGDWQTLISGEWAIPGDAADREPYYCVIATIAEDMYIKSFRPIEPIGTHHTVLTIYNGNKPDGIELCTAGTNGERMIYGSGVGSPEFHFPTGIGLHLPAGTRLLLNLHLYNASDNDLEGLSGVQFIEAEASTIQHDAEVVLAGPVGFNSNTGKVTGECSVSNLTQSDTLTVFAISQHMHKRGMHLKSTRIRAGEADLVFYDGAYDFDNQTFQYATPTFDLKPGDKIKTECTYSGDGPVMFGDSSDLEMCFTDIFYYPAQGAYFTCPF